ncbi:enolase C-terminal domain-like protein [Spirochaeta dissipatitropha]
MKEILITDVEVFVVDADQNYVIVRICTNIDGLFGLGDATLNGREPAVAEYIRQSFLPLLIGKEVRNHNAIWELLYKSAYWIPGSVAMTALSGIDMALWDLRGKIAGQPVWQLIGGKFRDRAEVYVHVSGSTEEELVAGAQARVEEGYTAIRVQASLSDDNSNVTYGTTEILPVGHPLVEVWDAEMYIDRVPAMLSSVRSAVGPRIKLLHDSHERLTVSEAIRFSRKIEDADLYFWEDPFRPESAVANLTRIRSGYCVQPIAFGELLNRYDEVMPYLSGKLIDFIRVDLSHVGGITAALKIAHLAQMFDVMTAWHGPPDLSPIGHLANIHVDLAVQNFGIQEWCPKENGKSEALFGRLPVPEHGAVALPDPEQPGLGCSFSTEAAGDYPYQQRFLPIAVRTDGTIIDW